MKRIFRILVLALCVVVAATSLAICPSAEGESVGVTTNRYNIVFVNDESGSMSINDNQKFRYEAIRRFVSLMAQEGNRVGSVSFSLGILDSRPLTDMVGFEAKNEFVNHISQFAPSQNIGKTNIGLGLKTAVELLETGRDKDLPSIIILLTDGDTQMPTEREKNESLAQKADAIEAARKAGYPIYSICLGDGAHEEELKQIATATGGEYAKVSKAQDLDEVQMMFYKIIFNALSGEASEAVIGADGQVSQSFDVPGIGVEELNIIIEGNITDCKLEDPNGKVYSGSDLSSITMIGRDFRLIKVTDPSGGKWTVTVYGDSGTKVEFKPLYNSAFYIETSVGKAAEYRIGDTLNFKAVICDKSGPVTDTARYGGFVGEVHLSFQGKETVLDMTTGDGGLVADYKIENEGTYYAYITVKKDDLVARSEEEYEFSVNNRAPVPAEEEYKVHTNIWPFFGGKATIDLASAVTDPDGDAVTYTIESAAFNGEDYTFENNVLTVENFSIPKGSFSIRAMDARGAYCTFNVLVSSTNIGLIATILLGVGILIALIAIIVVIKVLAGKAFMGTITAENLETGAFGAPQKNRGQLKLSAFQIGQTGFDGKKCHFQATGKNYVYFKSNKPFTADCIFGSTKKLKIESSMDVMIYSDAEQTKGIRVRFESMLNNSF